MGFTLGYPDEKSDSQHMWATVRPGLGVAVYRIQGNLCAQMYPLTGGHLLEGVDSGFSDYVMYVVTNAKSGSDDLAKAIKLYPFFNNVDPLTLKCLIEEAAETWSKQHVATQPYHANASTRENVERHT